MNNNPAANRVLSKLRWKALRAKKINHDDIFRVVPKCEVTKTSEAYIHDDSFHLGILYTYYKLLDLWKAQQILREKYGIGDGNTLNDLMIKIFEDSTDEA